MHFPYLTAASLSIDSPRFAMGSSHPLKIFEPLWRAHPKEEKKENGREEDQGERIVRKRSALALSPPRLNSPVQTPDGPCLRPQLQFPFSEVRTGSVFGFFHPFSLCYNNIVALFPTTKGREDEDDVVLDNDCGRPTNRPSVRPTKRPPSLLSPPAVPRAPALRSPSANRSHVVTMNFSRSIAPSPKEEIAPFPLGLEGLMVQRSHTVRLIDMSD